MKTKAMLIATALAALALVAPVTPASAAWTATSCRIQIFTNPALGSDYGELTYVNDKGETRTRQFSPAQAEKRFAKDVTGYGCIYDYIG